ncbi:hypothetical protein OH76DRAFT_515301 [Lentinus brumalis]|uniref:Uncharacterized protein n=1 Tax=Lentinus brumalis TaxID=2498619 RepID=A0A371CHU0_9APHY|nr:hypothetical protein OH76DRAFT_515301 [Polyporus brumalis]
MSSTPSAPPVEPQLPPRGACVNEACAHEGLCAGWAVIVNGVLRSNPLHSHEACGACGHTWWAHSIEDVELDLSRDAVQRRGCPRSQCGGFCTSDSTPSAWTFDTLCDCGVELRAHLPLYAPHRPYGPGYGRPAGSGIQNGPPASYGNSLPAPPGLAAPAPTTFAGTSAVLAAASPVAAYAGLRPAEPGSTNDMRVASYERMRNSTVGDFALNQPRTRTPATISTPGSGASSVASGAGLVLHDSPTGPPTVNIAVHMFPVKHPADKARFGVWPKTTLDFTEEDYVTVLERCLKFHLVFQVALPAHGPVWTHLQDAVTDHCRRNGLVFAGYDDTVPATDPTKLPFILLSCNTKIDQPVKKYNIYDSLNVTTFTAKSLSHKRFAGQGCPLPGSLAGMQMLRLVPRYGDIHAHLLRPSLSSVPGLQDYYDISSPEETHPCFPARVLLGVHPHLHAECLPECPRPAEVLSPSLAPSSPAVLGELHLSDDTSPFALEDFRPDPPLFLPSTPSPVGGWAPSHISSAMPEPAAPAMDMQLRSDDIQVPLPASAALLEDAPRTPRRRRRQPRPGHMTTGGSRPPRTRARVAAQAQENNDIEADDNDDDKENTLPGTEPAPSGSGSSLGVRHREVNADEDGITQRQYRPSNRRRMFSPVADEADDIVAADVVLQDLDAAHEDAGVRLGAEEVLGQPLKIPTWKQFIAWTERVMDTIPFELDAVPLPRIRAPDVDSAARILTFLVRWLIRHKNQPSRGLDDSKFRDALFAEVRIRGSVCDLTTLEQLLRHADGFECKAGHGLGRSVLEVVLRRAIQMLLDDDLCFQDIGPFKSFRWMLDGRWSDPTRLESMSVLGFLCMMCMIGRFGGPHPFSPIALRHAIEGRQTACLMDMPFLRLLDQGLYQQFRPWALHDPTIPISDGDRALKGLIMGGGMDPGNIGIPSPDAWASMERTIFSTATLGAPDIDEFVDFKAFVAGMSVCIPGGDLDKLFEYRARDYLARLCSQRLEDPQVVLDHLFFERSNAETDLPIDKRFEKVFADRVREFLLGVGHPDLPAVRELVGEDAFLDHKSNPLLRARLFLQMMTGSDLVPMNPNFMLKFTFTHTGDRAELPAGAPVPQPPPVRQLCICAHGTC